MSPELARIILAQICLHACMAGTRMAAPLLALREGYSPAAVGVLLALFALPTATGSSDRWALASSPQ